MNSGITLCFAWIVSVACVPGQLWAQKGDSIQLTRAAILASRDEIVEQAMSLTPAEQGSFKSLYREWRDKVKALGDRKIKLIEKVVDGAESLTDAETRPLTDEWLKIQKEELALKVAYVGKFRKILPEKKVARFFQLENKLDAALLYNLAGTIPMIE